MTKILLVDDEPSIVKMVGKRLEIEGYQVVVAMDGEEALAKVETEMPNLIILDFMLPKMNGYEVCSTLKKNPKFQLIPILLFTAKAMESGDKLEAACGANGYVRKPFQSAELLEAIRNLLSGKRAPAQEEGFTLIELMLVIIIIAALAAMVVPRLAGRTEQARVTIAKTDINSNLTLALRLYEVDNGRYPTTEQGLQALITKPTAPPVPNNWKGPYIEQQPADPWGKPYVYRYPGTHPPRDYDLYSYGPDGIESEDDISNWK